MRSNINSFLISFLCSFLISLSVILLYVLLTQKRCNADEFHLIQLDEVNIDYKNYAIISDQQRNLLIYPEHPKESLNLNLNTTFAKYGYFNSTVESLTTSSQYRGIGLQLSLGVRLSKYLDFGYWHHSQHVMDREMLSIPTFPTEDTMEIKLYLYRTDKKESIF